MQTYPGLLFHPNIPKPLHGMAPRVFLGSDWWNAEKTKAKAKFNNHCWACGIHKTEAKYHQWLEAHECYSIDYSTGCVEYKGTVALCHSCHNYIHDGRMLMITQKGEMSTKKYIDIINHGNQIIGELAKAKGVKFKVKKHPFEPNDLTSWTELHPSNIKWTGKGAEWKDYHMVINGVVYPQKFKSLDEWRNYYA